MDQTFEAALDRIASNMCGDPIVGQVSFNQPYAAVQHERQDYNHPRGGQAGYLRDALLQDADTIFREVAKRLVSGHAVEGMADGMEMLGNHASTLAPVDTGRLRGSDHPEVYVGDLQVYDRAPVYPREEYVKRGRQGGSRPEDTGRS